MDLTADTGEQVPAPAQDIPVPPVDTVITRSVPVAAGALLGLPLLGLFLPTDAREGWWALDVK